MHTPHPINTDKFYQAHCSGVVTTWETHPEFLTALTQKYSPILIKHYTERQWTKILTGHFYHFYPYSIFSTDEMQICRNVRGLHAKYRCCSTLGRNASRQEVLCGLRPHFKITCILQKSHNNLDYCKYHFWLLHAWHSSGCGSLPKEVGRPWCKVFQSCPS